jgi:hypothetical protein
MEDEIIFYKSKVLLFTIRLVIWIWCWAALLILAFIPLFVFKIKLPFIAILLLFFTSAVFYSFLAFSIRCQNCNKFVTVQPLAIPPYSNENKIMGFSGWSGIILNVFKNRRFVCMHCGKKYLIKT